MNMTNQKNKNSTNINDILKDMYKSQNNYSNNNKKIPASPNVNNAELSKKDELVSSPSKYSQHQILSKEEFEEIEPKRISQNEFYQPSGNSNRNMMLLKNLKEQLDQLESEKIKLEKEISQLRKNSHLLKAEEYNKKVQALEKERNESKATATHYLHICSQLAEEVIVLRDQLDKYSHAKKDK